MLLILSLLLLLLLQVAHVTSSANQTQDESVIEDGVSHVEGVYAILDVTGAPNNMADDGDFQNIRLLFEQYNMLILL